MLTAKATILRWRLIGFLYISSLLFVLFQGGKTSLMLFCIFNVLLVYLVFGRWSGIAQVSGERRLANGASTLTEQALVAGTRLEVNIDVQIPGFWPIPYVLVRDRLIAQNGSIVPFEASFVPNYRRAGSVNYTTPPLERGVYRFEATECSTRDIFGLFEHTGTFDSSIPFSVYPRTASIRDWRQMRRGFKGPFSTSVSRSSSKETTQINGVREYIYGDRLSRIHWNATAKTGQWKSREFERESLPRMIVMLDRYTGAYENKAQFELAVSAAASLLEFGFRRSTAVGLISVGTKHEGYAPNASADQRDLMMKHLVRVQADGDQPLYRALRQSGALAGAGAFVIIVSPQPGEETIRAMEWLNRTGVMPVLVHLKRAEDERGGKVSDIHAGEWLRLLRRSGFTVYTINKLQELPEALEGGRV
ncbi:DUF58 domain-containing protein [Paenibacillus sacheonensis]|uniref:DUF58 domain-containing protein n=1 Tax=Paenibacillus sacheonensis TaxID=742054 RepID=A0A7X5C1J8_9BACL|nr:DUF58 domain-containing protein [Paenibacillus sacheonensis]MBM7565583.1 uncharacterized protein (DUF58 family) [Paenibacillus sacheonensis]NBC69499.1 DUF58 domain-containing protein [Paenibacillus sacheonensis]